MGQTKLVVTVHVAGGASRAFRFSKWASHVRIGSDSQCEVIVAVPNVAPIHAEVQMSKASGEAHLVDRSGDNTLCDGRVIDAVVLPFGRDVSVALRNTAVRIDLHSLVPASDPELRRADERHVKVLKAPPAKPESHILEPLPQEVGVGGLATVTVRAAGLEEKFFVVPSHSVKIGRSRGCEIHIPEGVEEISGEHARLSWSNGWLLLEDLQSSNGTMINGRRLDRIVLRPSQLHLVELANGVVSVAVVVTPPTETRQIQLEGRERDVAERRRLDVDRRVFEEERRRFEETRRRSEFIEAPVEKVEAKVELPKKLDYNNPPKVAFVADRNRRILDDFVSTTTIAVKEQRAPSSKELKAHITACGHPACVATRRLEEAGANLTPGKGRHCELAVLAAAGEAGISDADLVAGRRAYADHLRVSLDGNNGGEVANANWARHARHAADGNVVGESEAVHPINLGPVRVLRTPSSRGVASDHYVMIGLRGSTVAPSGPASTLEPEPSRNAVIPQGFVALANIADATQIEEVDTSYEGIEWVDCMPETSGAPAASTAMESQRPNEARASFREDNAYDHGENLDQERRRPEDTKAIEELDRRRVELEASLQRERQVDQERRERDLLERQRFEEERRLFEEERRRFDEARQRGEFGDEFTTPTLVTHLIAEAGFEWLLGLPEGGTRDVFRHLATHGQVNEVEATRMLKGARQFRRFSNEFDALRTRVPFGVRIETAANVKTYVRDDRLASKPSASSTRDDEET